MSEQSLLDMLPGEGAEDAAPGITGKGKKMAKRRAPKKHTEERTTGRRPYGLSVYCYPSEVQAIGGHRGVLFAQAVQCFDQLLHGATSSNAGRFKPAEWLALARAMEGHETSIDPIWSAPGERLAEMVERAAEMGVEGAGAAGLAEKLRKLDYLHAWAIIWALQVRKETSAPDDAEWWGLPYRHAHQVTIGPAEKLPEKQEDTP